MTQAEFLINEIGVLIETFALVKYEECLSCSFIMQWFIDITLFHGRKDMNQPFSFNCFVNNHLNMVIFTKRTEFTDEFNFNTIFIHNELCILSELLRKSLSKT